MSGCIGIDLGTTMSCAAHWDEDGAAAKVIPNSQGARTTPSWVAFTPAAGRVVGEAAVQQQGRNLKGTLYDAKRLIGRRFGDEEVQADLQAWPFDVVAQEGTQLCAFKLPSGELVSPEEVGAAILSHFKRRAGEFLGKELTDAVVTVPAYFNDAQRQATKDAGRIAGLDVKRIINEPTAAALAYGLDKREAPIDVLVFDFGGGTLDVTVLTVDQGTFEVLSTSGDTHLGGADFDWIIMRWFAEEYCKAGVVPGVKPEDLLEDAKALRKLQRKARSVKHSLSSSLEVEVEIDALYNGEDLYMTCTRVEFNKRCSGIFDRMLAPVAEALKDASLGPNEIDEVVLIGGSTRVPEVQERLSRYFGGKSLNKSINPDEAVACGAAIQAANLTLAAEDKAGTKLEGLTLMDVTPLSLGIELANGKLSVLVPRNTTVPVVATRTFYNNKDDQKYANVIVYEGEEPVAKQNRLLGKFRVGPLPPKKRGTLAIEVCFRVSVESVLTVDASAKVDGSTIDGKLVIAQNKGLLTEEQLQHMEHTASALQQQEETASRKKVLRHSLLEFVARVQADSEQYPTDVKTLIHKMLMETNEWLAGADISPSEMEAQLEYLQAEWDKLKLRGTDLFQ